MGFYTLKQAVMKTPSPQFLHALESAKKLKDPLRQADVLSNLAYIYGEKKEFARGISTYNQAITLANQGGDPRRANLYLGSTGVLETRAGRMNAGEKILREAIADALKQGYASNQIAWYKGLAYNLLEQGRSAEALKTYVTLDLTAKRSELPREEVSARVQAGKILTDLGKFDLAATKLKQALKTAKKLADPALLSTVYEAAGTMELYRGDFGKAGKNYQQALKQAKMTKNPQAISYALLSLGELHVYYGRSKIALKYFNEALSQTSKPGGGSMESLIIPQIYRVYLLQGKYWKALEQMNQTLKMSEKNNDPHARVDYQYSLGVFYSRIFEWEKAKTQLEKALRTCSNMGMEGQRLAILILLSEIHRKTGRPSLRENPSKKLSKQHKN